MRWIAAAVFAICLAAVAIVPPFLGLANNGDFAKVAGHLSLAAVDNAASNFIYFQPDYVHADRNHWDSPYTSSETLLGWIAQHLAGATWENAPFDIRALGAVHLALWVAALAIIPLRGRYLLVAALAIFVFTDICYSSYLNTFYMDAAALSGLLLTVACAVSLALTGRPTPPQIAITTLAALLYVTSKTQHAIWFFLPAALLLWTGRRFRPAIGAGAVVACAGIAMLVVSDPTNRDQALFNKLFFQIGPHYGGEAALRELGVRPDEMRYVGTHSYVPNSPAGDQDWVAAFYRHTGYPRLLAWYLRHPAIPFAIVRDVLARDAPDMRQNNLSNYTKDDGRPLRARTNRFALWSNARSWMFAHWLWHMPIWYMAFTAMALRTALRGNRLGYVAVGVAALGAGQFAVAALADCLETGRHLFLFHACTELTFLFAAAWALSLVTRTSNLYLHHHQAHSERPVLTP